MVRAMTLGVAILFALALAASAGAGGVTQAASPAGSATTCSESVLLDWIPDGEIDGSFSRWCLRQAGKTAPADVKEFTSFTRDVRRAIRRTEAGGRRPDVRLATVMLAQVGPEPRRQFLSSRPSDGRSANIIARGRGQTVRFRINVRGRRGGADLENVRVRVSLEREGAPGRTIVTRTIKRFAAGSRKAVRVGFRAGWRFGEMGELTVAVLPVEDEAVLHNNSRAYQLIFDRQ